jgi:hypothetical protein
MFNTQIVSVCSKCFIYFKCMLHSSVLCCKCRPPALVSIDAWRRRRPPPAVWERRHRLCGAVMKEAGANLPSDLPSDLEETGIVPVWKRRRVA